MFRERLNWREQLAARGYRVTAPRSAVMAVLAESEVPLCPKAITERAEQDGLQSSLVTVYRTLELLTELGLVRRVHGKDACQGYVLASPGHYHAIVCRRCGQVAEFAGYDDLDGLEAWAAKETGFAIDGHLLQLYGICSDCRKELSHVSRSER